MKSSNPNPKVKTVRKVSALERSLSRVTPDFHGVDVKTMLRNIPYKLSGDPFVHNGFRLVVARSLPPNRDMGVWRVLEASAGIALSAESTRKAAIDSSLRILCSQSERTISEAHAFVASTIKRIAAAAKKQGEP